jgi:hypothetical protein
MVRPFYILFPCCRPGRDDLFFPRVIVGDIGLIIVAIIAVLFNLACNENLKS